MNSDRNVKGPKIYVAGRYPQFTVVFVMLDTRWCNTLLWRGRSIMKQNHEYQWLYPLYRKKTRVLLFKRLCLIVPFIDWSDCQTMNLSVFFFLNWVEVMQELFLFLILSSSSPFSSSSSSSVIIIKIIIILMPLSCFVSAMSRLIYRLSPTTWCWLYTNVAFWWTIPSGKHTKCELERGRG